MHILTLLTVASLCLAPLSVGCKGDPDPKPTQPPAPVAETAAPIPGAEPADATVTPSSEAPDAVPTQATSALATPDTTSSAAVAADTTAPTLPPLAAGVMGDERLEAWNAYRATPIAPDPSADRPSALSRGGKCGGDAPVADDDDACIRPLPGAIGLRKDGAVALLGSAPMGSCADVPAAMIGIIAMLPSLRAGATVDLPKTPLSEDDAIDDPEAAIELISKAVWAWIKRLPAAGFEPAKNLIQGVVLAESGIRMVEPSALLGPPLKGWFLDTVPGKDAINVRLVSPDNQREFAVGSIAHVSGDCSKEELEEGSCGDYNMAGLSDVVLSLDQKHLIATVTLTDGSHCGIDLVQHKAWPVPAGLPLSP